MGYVLVLLSDDFSRAAPTVSLVIQVPKCSSLLTSQVFVVAFGGYRMKENLLKVGVLWLAEGKNTWESGRRGRKTMRGTAMCDNENYRIIIGNSTSLLTAIHEEMCFRREPCLRLREVHELKGLLSL